MSYFYVQSAVSKEIQCSKCLAWIFFCGVKSGANSADTSSSFVHSVDESSALNDLPLKDIHGYVGVSFCPYMESCNQRRFLAI